MSSGTSTSNDSDSDSDGDSDGVAASGDRPHQVLEVRLRYIFCLVDELPNEILYESPPMPLVRDALIHLPLHQMEDDPVNHIAQLLSSLTISAGACGAIASKAASCVLQTAAGTRREVNFHIVAVVDYIQMTWMQEVAPGLYRSVVKETPPVMKKVKMEKLEEIGEEGIGDCRICLNEFNCNEREVIKIPCGHVYHLSCIFKWLDRKRSCPLCRVPLPLEDWD